jgi:hypothetical protein
MKPKIWGQDTESMCEQYTYTSEKLGQKTSDNKIIAGSMKQPMKDQIHQSKY